MSSTSSPLRYSWSTCCYLSVATRNFTCARRGGHVAARHSPGVLKAPVSTEDTAGPACGASTPAAPERPVPGLSYATKALGATAVLSPCRGLTCLASRARTVAFRKCLEVTRGPYYDEVSLPRRGELATARTKRAVGVLIVAYVCRPGQWPTKGA